MKVELNNVDDSDCQSTYRVSVVMQIYSILYDNKIMIRQNHRSMDRGVLESQFCAGNMAGGKDTCNAMAPISIEKNKQTKS